jgi:hypothetical protein
VTATAPRDIGRGPLSRASAFVYTLLVVEAMLIGAAAPGLVALAVVLRYAPHVALVAVCAVPAGPAISASIYALRHRSADLFDLKPMRQFWHGYRINLRAVLPVWLIGLAWLWIVAVTLANFRAAGVPAWWAAILALIGVLAALWLTNALIVTSLFDFRTADAIRLAWELIPRQPLVMLGNGGVLLAAALLTVTTNEIVVGLLGSTLLMALVRTSRPMIDLITREYTA